MPTSGLAGPQIGPYIVTPGAPATPEQIAADLAQSRVDYAARGARCQAYQQKDWALTAGAGALAAFVLPGWWKILALPFMFFVDTQIIPRSPDCDYGF